jgi:hypothetical protein
MTFEVRYAVRIKAAVFDGGIPNPVARMELSILQAPSTHLLRH